MPSNPESTPTIEDNNSSEAPLSDKSRQEIGKKVLSRIGFESHQKEITESSFNKARKSGEKLQGNNAERRNQAYLNRIERLVEKYGNDAEKRLWEASAAKLVVQQKDIPESFWVQREQTYRDNGHGEIHMDEYQRKLETKHIQKLQENSLESWSNYLGDKNSPYPMWFKVYAWDGMSKMGAFDKDKRHYAKRDKGTVAPYPNCNPAVLAKTYGLISDFYNNDPNERYKDQDKEQAEMEALVKSGNFNKLYSKILLEQKTILKTPERTEDIHGEWVEYLPGQEDEVSVAAEGTPWCIADPGTARSYLEHRKYRNDDGSHPENGKYGNDDDYNNDYDYSQNKAKFILFHLKDPKTGQLADNACASIRLDLNGNVAEISGLNNGQALEDSLVPIVEAKVKALPGGEKFLEAFEDKQELIRLDHKMKKDEPLTKEEYEFLYEVNKTIKTLDTYNDVDPRIPELREKYDVEKALTVGINPDILANSLIEKDDIERVADNPDKFLAAGANPTALANNLIENDEGRTVAYCLDKFVAAGANPTALANNLIEKNDGRTVAYYLDKFVATGADPTALANNLIEKNEGWTVANNLDKFVAAGVDPTALANNLIENDEGWIVADNLDKFVAAGADREELFDMLNR